MGIWDIYEWNLLFLPICPGKRWQHPPWWTYHPPVHDRAPAALAPRTSANLVVLPLVTWSPSLAVAVPTECEFHPKKLMAGSWWCDFSKWSWDWSWFCLLMSCPTRPKIPEFGEKDENPAGKKKNDFWWLNSLNMVKPPFPSFFRSSCLLRFKRKNIPGKKKKRTRFYRLNIPINVSCSPPITHFFPTVLRHSLCCATSFWASVRRSSQVFTIPFSLAGNMNVIGI